MQLFFLLFDNLIVKFNIHIIIPISFELLFSFPTFDRPWDFSIQDTSEEVRLIFHMWIGLFYSRSTPRFFSFDSIEEGDSLNTATSAGPTPAQSSAASTNVCDTSDDVNVNALDLSKKDCIALEDHAIDILDLSQSSAHAKHDVEPHAKQRKTSGLGGEKEAGGTHTAFESTTVPQKVSTFQVWILQHCF